MQSHPLRKMRVSQYQANLYWVDQEMGTAISCNQVAGLMLKDVCQTLVSYLCNILLIE